jgi:hypothetical protein
MLRVEYLTPMQRQYSENNSCATLESCFLVFELPGITQRQSQSVKSNDTSDVGGLWSTRY